MYAHILIDCTVQVHTDSFAERNKPVGPCPVCLMSLEEEFFKTPCYHYFHSYCLGKSLESQEDGDKVCPVCRESLGPSIDIKKLLEAPNPDSFGGDDDDGGDVTSVLKAWKAEQTRFKHLYDRQVRKGGIIDLEEEAKRCLVITRNPEAR